MHLVEILLPAADNTGRPIHPRHYDELRDMLTRRFGGLTAFSRSPAKGFWRPGEEVTHVDDVIIFEVMADELDREWWGALRKELERAFQQAEIVIRSHEIERL